MTDYLNSDPGLLLVKARQSGDPGELLVVYRSYLKVLARVQIGQQLQGKADASDVAQDALLNATKGFRDFRGTTEQELLAWLRKILSNVMATLVRNYLGTKQRNILIEKSLDENLSQSASRMQLVLKDTEASPSQVAMRKENAVLLSEALEKLPEDYRDVVVLRHIEQLSFKEVAERMGRSVDSVRNLWPRALAKLKHSLEGKL